jgi:hypothetical protein
MSTTVAIRNCGLRRLNHPQFGGMSADPTVSKSKVLKQVNADVYSSRYSNLAKFGVHVTENGVDHAGSAVVTGTGNVGTTNQMIVVDMTANMTLTLPTLASVPAGWLITIYLRSRTSGTLSVDGNGAETVMTVATPTYTTVGSVLRIRKGASTTDWEAATV